MRRKIPRAQLCKKTFHRVQMRVSSINLFQSLDELSLHSSVSLNRSFQDSDSSRSDHEETPLRLFKNRGLSADHGWEQDNRLLINTILEEIELLHSSKD